MTARIVAALYLCLALGGASGQTGPAASEVVPPDQKAFAEAGKLTDPEQKIAAFEKLQEEFPGSRYAGDADWRILSTLIGKLPEQKERIRKLAEGMLAEARAKEQAKQGNASDTMMGRGGTATRIADELATAGVLLEDAERWAREGVEAMREDAWVAQQRAAYARRAMKVPPRSALARQFTRERAARVGTLGRVEWKLGHAEEARKLLEESYGAVPADAVVGGALGEMAAQAGEDSKALEYLIPVMLSGHASGTATRAFDAIYRKGHGGTLEGEDAMLDAEYGKRFPNPIHVEAYRGKRSDRVVLAEVFTGAGCPPCVGADVAFDAAMERYGRQDLAVVMYHVHVPRPDPMTTEDTMARYEWYGKNGVPAYAIDGKKTLGGESRERAGEVFKRFQKDLEKDLTKKAEARLKIDAGLNGGTVKVAAAVDGVKSGSADLRVQILLVQKEIRYGGENGIRLHPMVVRAFGGEKGGGYALGPRGSGTFEAGFELEAISAEIRKQLDAYEAKGHRGTAFTFTAKKDRIERGNLAVVVFVQDDKTRHVLQAGYVDLAAPGGGR